METTVARLLQFHTFRQMQDTPKFKDKYEVKVKTPSELVDLINKKDHLVWFYAHWCWHCEIITDEWDKLITKKNDLKCDLLEIDCAAFPEIRDFMGEKVKGYPTILYIDKKFNTVNFELEQKSRTAENFVSFVEKNSN